MAMSRQLILTPLLALLFVASVQAAGEEVTEYPYAVDWTSGSCETGVRQSPIDIVTTQTTSGANVLSRLQTDWNPDANGNLTVTDHNIQYDLSAEASAASTMISNNGETFYLKQFHIHSPSEHTIDGLLYPLEAHFVHLNEAGDKAAVIGINFHYSTQVDNAFLPPFIDMAMQLANRSDCNPQVATCTAPFPDTPDFYHTDFGRLITEDSTYYAYEGSLTTPPCSEIVSWHVLRQSVPISPDQIMDLQTVLYLALGTHGAANNRPPQPLNFRTVWMYPGADFPVAVGNSTTGTPCNTSAGGAGTPGIIIQGASLGGESTDDPSNIAVAGLALACVAVILSLMAVMLVLFCIVSQAKQMLNMALANHDAARKGKVVAP
eukprot:jgi/Mesvir1/17512/Mv26491-RA.1